MAKRCEGKLGLIVNPIAGMGGAAGLKGTDGAEALHEVFRLGVPPVAPRRCEEFLQSLSELDPGGIEILTAAGRMGEEEVKKFGFKFRAVGEAKRATTREDTLQAARLMVSAGVDLLAFCGGDGTARDICDVVERRVPVLGIPAGVKMYSAVFAVNPREAARLACLFLEGQLSLAEREILDVDEAAFRADRLSARLYGYLRAPMEVSILQPSKALSGAAGDEEENRRAIARYVVENMEPGVCYVLGPGSTVAAIGERLGVQKTLLGVDVVRDFRLLAKDVNEPQLFRLVSAAEGGRVKVVVTPIGGQGFIFGRGNQQVSPRVLRRVGRENLIVVATQAKLQALRALRVDTGEPSLDSKLRGYIRVVTDYGEETVMKIL